MPARPLQSDRELGIRCRMNAGGYIRRLREELGITQAELAHLVGLKVISISQIENGRGNVPSQRAPDFAYHLAVDPQDFALMIFQCSDPYLFAMIFPNASLDPFVVPPEDMRRAVSILERRASQRKERRAR